MYTYLANDSEIRFIEYVVSTHLCDFGPHVKSTSFLLYLTAHEYWLNWRNKTEIQIQKVPLMIQMDA